MLAARGFLHVNDLQRIPLSNDLRLQRVPLFFLNNTLFGSFWGGLPGFQSHRPPRIELTPVFF